LFTAKLKDYAAFSKLRLASLVVFSALCGYLMAADTTNWKDLILLLVGGFFVTGSSNGFNQIIEREPDKVMKRTQNRPLPQNRMSVKEAVIVASAMGLLGVVLLYLINPLSALLGAVALMLYTAVYTPMKKETPFAVFIGAFPGAIPPMLGYIAFTGALDLEAWVLFAVQFMWQFPHFWAIAWKLDDDYKLAGFKMLPSGNRDKSSAYLILVYTLMMIPASLLPLFFGISGYISAAIILLAGIGFLLLAVKLFNTLSTKDASKLMFASFIYLPVVQVAMLIDKL
jgi:protoheme IX farnesyltransferase